MRMQKSKSDLVVELRRTSRSIVAVNTPRPSLPWRSHGFTLGEMLIAVALIGVLAAIALPSYSESVYRAKMRTAQQDLVGMALHLENRFNRTLSYPAVTASTSASQAQLPAWSPASAATDFDFRITASTATGFTVTARGAGQMTNCLITLNQANVRQTSGCTQGGGAWM